MTHDQKIRTADRLSKMGGFYSKLAEALLLADNVNEEILINAFSLYSLEHKANLRLIHGRFDYLPEG
jgi:hypothetical protein